MSIVIHISYSIIHGDICFYTGFPFRRGAAVVDDSSVVVVRCVSHHQFHVVVDAREKSKFSHIPGSCEFLLFQYLSSLNSRLHSVFFKVCFNLYLTF